MNREIKFRAWCERDKTMYQEIGLHPFISQDHTKADEDSAEYVPESAGKGLFTLWPNESSWPIMQYTGLKDKNGVEIYEGDIVQNKSWDYPFQIIFNEEKARFVCKMKTGLTQYIDSENLIVIGNIHQNPELL